MNNLYELIYDLIRMNYWELCRMRSNEGLAIIRSTINHNDYVRVCLVDNEVKVFQEAIEVQLDDISDRLVKETISNQGL